MPKWGLKLYFEHNSSILTMSGQALIFKLSHNLWGFMVDDGFQYKNALSTDDGHYVSMKWFFHLAIKIFLMGYWSNDGLVVDPVDFW